MVNAIITKTTLSISSDDIPYAIFNFNYMENGKRVDMKTPPLVLIGTDETVQQSSLALGIITILNTVGVDCWENLIGKVVRLDFTEDNQLLAIYNVIEDIKIPIYTAKNNTNEEEVKE